MFLPDLIDDIHLAAERAQHLNDGQEAFSARRVQWHLTDLVRDVQLTSGIQQDLRNLNMASAASEVEGSAAALQIASR